MFGHKKSFRQVNIIKNFNIFIDAAKKAGIKTQLFELNEEGTCHGLTYAYEMYDHQEQGEDYILALGFINSLTGHEIHNLFIKYQSARRSGNKLIIRVQGSTGPYDLEFSKILTMLTGVHFSQNNSSLKEIGALWDKNYTFVCCLDDLKKKLKIMNLKEGQTIFMNLGTHVFRIKRKKEGYFLFEPNSFKHALSPLRDEEALANKIIKHYKPQLTTDYFVCSAQFISYAHESNPVLENAMEELGKKIKLEDYPDIIHLYNEYGQKKISRLDCAMSIQKIIPTEDEESEKFRIFIDTIGKYIDKENLKDNFTKNNIDIAPYHGVTILWLAAKFNQIELARKILKYSGNQINQAQNNGVTPLYMAAQNGNRYIVELLLNHPDIQVAQPRNAAATPLYIAAQKGYRYIVELLLNHPDIQVDKAINASVSVLIAHARKNDLEQPLKILIDKYYEKFPDKLPNFTPLHAAIFFGHDKIAEMLLASHADPHATIGGISCLELAEAMNRTHIVNLLTNPVDQNSDVIMPVQFSKI